MKPIFKSIHLLALIIVFIGCKKPCNMSLRIGEIVEIPIEFNGFRVSEIDNIVVYRLDNTNKNQIDTFRMSNILWTRIARSTNEIITDDQPNVSKSQFGTYESYFDNSTLIFDWYTGKDTLLNIEIKKSQEKIKGCHENDPNVRIDKLTFIHKGKTIIKGQSIQINKY